MQQRAPGFVVAHCADKRGAGAEGGEVDGAVRGAAGHGVGVFVAQNEHRRFARHPGDFAVEKLIGD